MTAPKPPALARVGQAEALAKGLGEFLGKMRSAAENDSA